MIYQIDIKTLQSHSADDQISESMPLNVFNEKIIRRFLSQRGKQWSNEAIIAYIEVLIYQYMHREVANSYELNKKTLLFEPKPDKINYEI